MKRKFIGLLCMASLALSLSSCSIRLNSTESVVTRIAEEVEVDEIQSSITETYKKVSKGCVGIYAKSDTSGSTGSGVIYKQDESAGLYYVVTNAHVVSDMTEFKIYCGDQVYIDASLVGYDTKNDIAVLTFTNDLTGREFYVNDIFNYEYTDLVSVGQTALIIGCPLGLEYYNTLTTGVVSQVDSTYIVTDAAINPGNSGGGMFNSEGRLIGLVYKKTVWTTSDGEKIPADGRGYAIPLDTVRSAITDIEENGTISSRPLLGIVATIVNAHLTTSQAYLTYKDYLPASGKDSYLIIAEFNETEDSPSNGKAAGLQQYDIILEADGKEIVFNADLTSVLTKKMKGDTILLKIYRSSEKKELEINVTLN